MTTTEIQDKIRKAYGYIRPDETPWLAIADLRDVFPKVPRDEMDKALKGLAAQPGVHVIPVANMKGLAKADRDAALWMGGEWNHAIMIDAR